jgi:chaperonin GroEL (HSP60 family)
MMRNSVSEKTVEVDEVTAALNNNAAAVLAVSRAVEGTLGPKGLDTMMVGPFGEILVTNSGVAILEKMEISHPASRMILEAAKSQYIQVGDGTTTAIVMAAAILKEGIAQILKGVPVSRLLEGIEKAAELGIEILREKCRIPVTELQDPFLLQVAVTAGRGDEKTAAMIFQAAQQLGKEKISSHSFKFADIIFARTGVEDQLIKGTLLSKGRVSTLMPVRISSAVILLLEDNLGPEEVENESLRTESGFKKNMDLKQRFLENLQRILSLGVNVVFTTGGIEPEAEEILIQAGAFAARRITSRDLKDISNCTGARSLKRSGLNRTSESIRTFLGKAESVFEMEEIGMIVILGGVGKPSSTLLVGANTDQVTEEKRRKTRDAASSLQAAFQSGVVPGGGASELTCVRFLESRRSEFSGMTSYGLDCVIQGLKQPFFQMAVNAGYNSLEKTEEICRLQSKQDLNSLSLDFETGESADMLEKKVVDPLKVKVFALKTASEVAQAILRINRVVKMRDHEQIS